MPSSGGSVSDAPIEKTVDGKHHQLAYITPNEAQTLVDQGGNPTMTNEGIVAYPSWDVGKGTTKESYDAGRTGDHRDRDQDEDAASLAGHVQYAPTHHIENIHGEFDDPGSASYDPTYNAREQAIATRASAFGTGKHAGDDRWNPTTQKMERVQDYTFKEHWDRAPDALKWSPTLRLLYASGKNLSEWTKAKGWSLNPGTGTITDEKGNNVGERVLMNAVAPEAPELIANQSNTQTTSGSYSASQWYANLGNTNTTGSNPFSFSTAFADAKAKQQTILGNPSAIRQLAVNESPFYNWLKENSLNKGIL